MVDSEKVKEAIRLLLEGIGEDPTREGLVETPDRVARMWEELAGGMESDASEHLSRTFAVNSNDLVIERDITFYSMCEHHMLPFYGRVAIGYIPRGRVAGLSKLGAHGRGLCASFTTARATYRADCRCADGASDSRRARSSLSKRSICV